MNEEITKARKQNMKIYSLYRAVALDLIFYYAIEFLFLTQIKQISGADIVLSNGFYAVFMILFQIPASIIVDRMGTRRCTILANMLNRVFVILIMCCKNLGMLIFAQFISAMCFSLKDISDTTLIRYSIPETKKKGEIYSKLEGKGRRSYFLLNACTSFCAGFLYVIHPYIPMIASLCFTIAATVISLGFRDIEEERKEKQKELLEEYLQKRQAAKQIQQEMLNEKIAKMEQERSRLAKAWAGERQMAAASNAYEANVLTETVANNASLLG